MKSLLILSVLLLALSSCTKECRSCKEINGLEVEFCKEENTIYTDSNGNEVSFDEMIADLENSGWICDG